MDWDRYKALCDSPDVFSRWMLEETCELVDPDLAALLSRTLAGERLPKPEGHRGGPETDMFLLNVRAPDVARICAQVDQAAVAGRTTRGARSLGGFREAWGECLRHRTVTDRVP